MEKRQETGRRNFIYKKTFAAAGLAATGGALSPRFYAEEVPIVDRTLH